MSTLSQIITTKHQEVQLLPDLQKLSSKLKITPNNPILKTNFSSKQPIIIAEIKPKSPSVGVIYPDLDVAKIVDNFEKIGANAISVLTDTQYFGGSKSLLQQVQTLTKKTKNLPILRKDFIVDLKQIYETKTLGADLILFIVKILTLDQLTNFIELALTLNLQPLIEINTIEEAKTLQNVLSIVKIWVQEEIQNLPNLKQNFDQIIVSVNNRNLETLELDLNTAKELFDYLPKNFVKFSLSGIMTKNDLKFITDLGYDGVLIGTGIAQNNLF